MHPVPDGGWCGTRCPRHMRADARRRDRIELRFIRADVTGRTLRSGNAALIGGDAEAAATGGRNRIECRAAAHERMGKRGTTVVDEATEHRIFVVEIVQLCPIRGAGGVVRQVVIEGRRGGGAVEVCAAGGSEDRVRDGGCAAVVEKVARAIVGEGRVDKRCVAQIRDAAAPAADKAVRTDGAVGQGEMTPGIYVDAASTILADVVGERAADDGNRAVPDVHASAEQVGRIVDDIFFDAAGVDVFLDVDTTALARRGIGAERAAGEGEHGMQATVVMVDAAAVRCVVA